MPQSWESLPLREIIEEDSYKERLKNLRVSYEDIDRAFEEVAWTLARNPEVFPSIPGTPLRRLRIAGTVRMPPLNIWFTASHNSVRLLWVEEAPE